ncbi:hypothetical protein [Clostridium magnum]|uniref:Uncharacterized protein n=1 Tax=Clostridium magnum DSM 2767 TaxID=1121326 RepID=A0A162QRP5_9CLOT|nr:hypothetical protein [Clostridium magnum]KZL88874.1 hypothetical protein CLMAG_57780 [Clostridium magnum DSM 2767]SHI51055.1 hypothetical protein SAMN02745944_04420 [Clostridium magnum DSM 2767]
MCVLAKYEPACNIGRYKWDYKLAKDYPALKKLNMYLIELEDLEEFVGKYNKHYYVIAPSWAFNKIRRKIKEKEFIKNNWNRISFYKIQEEQKERFKPLEDRNKSYFAKKLTVTNDYVFINKNFRDWHNLYVIVSKHKLNIDEINDVFSQISNLDSSGSLCDYLVLKDIGFINLEMCFFHEEFSHLGEREENGEKILMYYCPWRLIE